MMSSASAAQYNLCKCCCARLMVRVNVCVALMVARPSESVLS
jgi:hypothetical protein